MTKLNDLINQLKSELDKSPNIDESISDILKIIPDKSPEKRNIPEVFFYSDDKMYYIGMGSGRLFEKPYNENVVNQIKRLKRLKLTEIVELSEYFLKK